MPRRRWTPYPPDSVIAVFGRNVQERRRACGLTQVQLAEQAGVSLSTVTNCECAVNGITLPLAVAIAGALGTRVSDLTGEKEA